MHPHPITLFPRFSQAHPELNYKYGRKVMDGMLDADAASGRLNHEEAQKLKQQVKQSSEK